MVNAVSGLPRQAAAGATPCLEPRLHGWSSSSFWAALSQGWPHGTRACSGRALRSVISDLLLACVQRRTRRTRWELSAISLCCTGSRWTGVGTGRAAQHEGCTGSAVPRRAGDDGGSNTSICGGCVRRAALQGRCVQQGSVAFYYFSCCCRQHWRDAILLCLFCCEHCAATGCAGLLPPCMCDMRGRLNVWWLDGWLRWA